MPPIPYHRLAVRKFVNALTKLWPSFKGDKNVKVSWVDHGVSRSKIYRPADPSSDGTLLWIHGGGYFCGNADIDDLTCLHILNALGITIISPVWIIMCEGFRGTLNWLDFFRILMTFELLIEKSCLQKTWLDKKIGGWLLHQPPRYLITGRVTFSYLGFHPGFDFVTRPKHSEPIRTRFGKPKCAYSSLNSSLSICAKLNPIISRTAFFVSSFLIATSPMIRSHCNGPVNVARTPNR